MFYKDLPDIVWPEPYINSRLRPTIAFPYLLYISDISYFNVICRADYVTWNGANPEFYKGQRNLAHGSNAALRSEQTYKAYGPNPELCKGPQAALSKGSIYSQNTSTSKTINVKCN